MIPYPQQDRVDAWSKNVHHDVLFLSRILHRVFNEVENRSPKFCGISPQQHCLCRLAAKPQRFRRQVVAQTSEFNRFQNNAGEVNFLPLFFVGSVTCFARFQYLLNGAKEPVGVFQHDPIEFMTPRFVELPAFQSLQVQANRSDGGLEFVGDRVEEAILLFISVDLANEENGVEDEARNDQSEKNDAEYQWNDLSPVEDDPRNVKRHRQSNQAGAQGHEERDLLGTTGNAHHETVQTILDEARTKKKQRGDCPAVHNFLPRTLPERDLVSQCFLRKRLFLGALV